MAVSVAATWSSSSTPADVGPGIALARRVDAEMPFVWDAWTVPDGVANQESHARPESLAAAKNDSHLIPATLAKFLVQNGRALFLGSCEWRTRQIAADVANAFLFGEPMPMGEGSP